MLFWLAIFALGLFFGFTGIWVFALVCIGIALWGLVMSVRARELEEKGRPAPAPPSSER